MRFRRLLILIFFICALIPVSEVWAQNIPVASIPFHPNNGHIIIKVKLEGKEPINFLFDSGAGGTLISRKMAESLGLFPIVSRKNVGVSGAHEVGAIKGVDLGIGEVIIKDITLLSTETKFEELDNGEIIHGVVGYPILSRYVVEVDFIKHELKLFDRTSYFYYGEGVSIPINIVMNLPVVEAGVMLYNGESFIGNFIIDTGARSELIISSPTVVWYDIANNVGEHYTLRKAIGTSKRRSKVRYGRLASVNFANKEFCDIPVALSSDNKGVLADPSFDGIIGNALLSRYNIVFDYYMNMLHIAPNQSIDKKFIVNTTGFNIVYKKGKPYLKDLIERSPADFAGLRNGDELIAIDGKSIAELGSKAVRTSLQEPGIKVELVVRRNKEMIKVEFVTESLI
ncbi:MAG: aspartyl protease family protein [Bacteroidota bacterium]